jgi:competence protein ComEA
MKNPIVDRRWLAVGAGVAALATGFLLPHPSPPATQVAPQATVPPQLGLGIDASLSASPSPSPGGVAVYVCGAVAKPGVYRLEAGARVEDAVKAAGGPTSAADLDLINLAEPLTDAMKVCVPRKGQALSDFGIADAAAAQAAAGSGRHHRGRSRGGGSRGGAHKLQQGQTLDVNTAAADQLVALPGVGPSLAQRIVDYRQQYGPFQTVDDLQNVPGIGPSKFDKMQPFVRL